MAIGTNMGMAPGVMTPQAGGLNPAMLAQIAAAKQQQDEQQLAALIQALAQKGGQKPQQGAKKGGDQGAKQVMDMIQGLLGKLGKGGGGAQKGGGADGGQKAGGADGAQKAGGADGADKGADGAKTPGAGGDKAEIGPQDPAGPAGNTPDFGKSFDMAGDMGGGAGLGDMGGGMMMG